LANGVAKSMCPPGSQPSLPGERVEGDPGLRSVVLVEFPDADSAGAWYDSPADEPLKAVRHGAARNNAVLITG
jgi:uncharacterized protein (DUF1330 family)